MNARILLVEDEKLIGTMVRINLEAEGWDVTWVRDGDAAREHVTGGGYDVMLLDLELPGRGGLELVADSRQAGIETPVLILTAHGGVDLKVRSLGLGADDFLAKPFDVAELVARVGALLRRTHG